MSDESAEMHVTRPVWKNEWNVTTVIALVMFVATTAAGYGAFVTTQNSYKEEDRAIGVRIDNLEAARATWVANHEQLHKDRLATVSAIEARVDQRLAALEASSRKQENIEYRVTVVEQGSANLARSVEELKTTVNNLGTDIRVIREILEREPR